MKLYLKIFASHPFLQNKHGSSTMTSCLINAYYKNIIKLRTHKCFGNPASNVRFIIALLCLTRLQKK